MKSRMIVGVMEWKNMLRVQTGWGVLTGQPTGYLGNGMEWNVGLGNTESGYLMGIRFGRLANNLTKLTRGRENEIHAEEGRRGMGGVWFGIDGRMSPLVRRR